MSNLVRLVNPFGLFNDRAASRVAHKGATSAKPSPATVPTPAIAAKPVPSKDAAVGTREWAACLLQQFGAKHGAEFVDRELTYMKALDEAVRIHRGEVSAEPAAAGFASKIKFRQSGLNPLKRKKRSTGEGALL